MFLLARVPQKCLLEWGNAKSTEKMHWSERRRGERDESDRLTSWQGFVPQGWAAASVECICIGWRTRLKQHEAAVLQRCSHSHAFFCRCATIAKLTSVCTVWIEDGSMHLCRSVSNDVLVCTAGYTWGRSWRPSALGDMQPHGQPML